MTFPITGTVALILAIVFGFTFGFLLQRGNVANSNTIINQFRLRDFTVAKVMFTAIIVGGIGILFLLQGGLAAYHIKPANLLGVGLGALLFGVGMAISGYCPGTALAGFGSGSVHALVTLLGMLTGAIAYALSFDWIKANILSLAALGPKRLPDVTGIPDLAWFAAFIVVATIAFRWLERRGL